MARDGCAWMRLILFLFSSLFLPCFRLDNAEERQRSKKEGLGGKWRQRNKAVCPLAFVAIASQYVCFSWLRSAKATTTQHKILECGKLYWLYTPTMEAGP